MHDLREPEPESIMPCSMPMSMLLCTCMMTRSLEEESETKNPCNAQHRRHWFHSPVRNLHSPVCRSSDIFLHSLMGLISGLMSVRWVSRSSSSKGKAISWVASLTCCERSVSEFCTSSCICASNMRSHPALVLDGVFIYFWIIMVLDGLPFFPFNRSTRAWFGLCSGHCVSCWLVARSDLVCSLPVMPTLFFINVSGFKFACL